MSTDRIRAPPGAPDDRPRGDAAAQDEEVGRLGHHHRPQEDRDHVPGPDVRVLHARRGRGADHAGAAVGPEQRPGHAREVQPAADAARDDDDLPVRRARDGGLRQLLRAADDRRPRHGVPAAERAVVLAARCSAAIVFYATLFFQPPEAGWWSYPPLSSALYSPSGRSGRVDLPDPHHRHLVARRRDQLLRDDRQHARAGDELGPAAAVRVVDPRLRDPADHRAAGRRRGGHDAADRPPLRHPLLRPDPARLAGLMAAPVLVLRPPRGLHHDLARVRDDLRDHPGVQPQADLRVQGDRRLDRRDRVPRDARLGPPHVRLAGADRRARLLHAELVPDRHPDRGQDLQLDRDAYGAARS